MFHYSGVLKERQGDLEEAVKFYDKEGAILGDVDNTRGCYVKLVIEYMGGTLRNPDWGKSVRTVAVSYVSICEFGRDGDLERVRKGLSEAFQKGCDEDYVHGMYGVVCQKMTDYKEAETHLLRAEELFAQHHPSHPVRADTLSALGRIYEEQRRDAEAVQSYRKLIQCNIWPDAREALEKRIADLETRISMREKAAAPDSQPESHPTDAATQLRAAEASLAAGRAADALKSTTEAVRLAPDDPAVLDAHARALYAVKDLRAVEKYAQEGIRAAVKAGNETLAAAILSTYADTFVAAYKVDQARVLWSSKENAFATGKMVVAAYPDNPQAASAYIGILNGPASEAQLARRSEIRRVAPRAVRAAHAKQLWKLATELGAEYAEAVAYAGNMPGSEPSWSPGECEEVRAQRPLEVFDLSIQAARRFCELARDKEQMELEVEARSDLSMIVARKILYLGWSVGGRNYAEALKVFHDHEAYAKTFHTQEGWYDTRLLNTRPPRATP